MNIIIEEDESRPSSPSSCYSVNSSPEGSSNLTLKAKRRHATVVSDIRLSRVFPSDDCLLSSPRPASTDSFNLTFTDVSFEFPHPPIPTPTSLRKYECDSPTSSLSSSPASQTEGMPLTPSTSDDEFGPPILSRRRPVIQPLVITKHNPRPSSLFNDDCAISPSLLQPFKNATESSAPLSPLSPSYLPEAFFDESDDASDSDPESDSEWYSKELSKVVSLRSPIPPSFPHQTSTRPDSMFIPSSEKIPGAPLKRRVSKPLPPTPSSGGFPSAQLDPAFPRRKSRRSNIPKYPPPPVPTISSPLPTSSPTSSSFSRRPPPRSSIPADCVYDPEDIEDIKQDDSSAFSFSIYDVYLGDEPNTGSSSLPSAYSQEDPIDGVSFDLDCSMMLPLSLPTTPFDLEADIAQGLEQLRNSPVEENQRPDFIIPEIREPEPEEQPLPPQQQQEVVDDLFSPTYTSDTTSPSYPYIITADEKILKSRWSTSTFGSVREEHESRGGASSKLRLYFSPLKNHKQGLKKSSSTTTPSSPPPPPSSPPSHKTPASPTGTRSPTRAHIRGYSDVMVIGYGNNGNGNGGVRRRGSVSNNSVSDAGSEESYSSTSSSGLRRKPIPVEMFLRSTV